MSAARREPGCAGRRVELVLRLDQPGRRSEVVVGAERDHEDVGLVRAGVGRHMPRLGVDRRDLFPNEPHSGLDQVAVRQSHGVERRAPEHHVELRVAEDEGVALVDERHVGLVAERLRQPGRQLETAEPGPENHDPRRGQLERQCVGGGTRDVDQRLDGEERADRDDQRRRQRPRSAGARAAASRRPARAGARRGRGSTWRGRSRGSSRRRSSSRSLRRRSATTSRGPTQTRRRRTSPMKPPVSGKPRKPSMNTHIETPRNGRSQPKPDSASSVTGTPSSRSRAATTANAPSDVAAYGMR